MVAPRMYLHSWHGAQGPSYMYEQSFGTGSQAHLSASACAGSAHASTQPPLFASAALLAGASRAWGRWDPSLFERRDCIETVHACLAVARAPSAVVGVERGGDGRLDLDRVNAGGGELDELVLHVLR